MMHSCLVLFVIGWLRHGCAAFETTSKEMTVMKDTKTGSVIVLPLKGKAEDLNGMVGIEHSWATEDKNEYEFIDAGEQILGSLGHHRQSRMAEVVAKCGDTIDMKSDPTMKVRFDSVVESDGQYPSRHRCKLKLKIPKEYMVLINFGIFELQPPNKRGHCQPDFLSYKRVGMRGHSGRFCGSMPANTTVELEKAEEDYILRILFKTNKRKEFRGFTSVISLLSTIDGPPCGVILSDSRIVGGRPATRHSIPWQVGITNFGFNQTIWCGGTIIDENTVVTAAHCVTDEQPSSISLRIGEHYDGNKGIGTRYDVDCLTIHPNYTERSTSLHYDLAVMKVKNGPIAFNSKVNAACLPKADNFYVNVSATVSGWGTLSFGGSQPGQLYVVDVVTMSNAQCRQTVYGNLIDSSMICASEEGRDSCSGDSGGPMTVTEQGITTLIGVVSWGWGCAEEGKPGVYARVNTELQWISNNNCTTP